MPNRRYQSCELMATWLCSRLQDTLQAQGAPPLSVGEIKAFHQDQVDAFSRGIEQHQPCIIGARNEAGNYPIAVHYGPEKKRLELKGYYWPIQITGDSIKTEDGAILYCRPLLFQKGRHPLHSVPAGTAHLFFTSHLRICFGEAEAWGTLGFDAQDGQREVTFISDMLNPHLETRMKPRQCLAGTFYDVAYAYAKEIGAAVH